MPKGRRVESVQMDAFAMGVTQWVTFIQNTFLFS